jgi:hypothetical protein
MWALAAPTSCLDKAAKRMASRRASLPECGGSAMGQDGSPGRDNAPIDVGRQLAAAAVVQVEGVQVGQQRHGPGVAAPPRAGTSTGEQPGPA